MKVIVHKALGFAANALQHIVQRDQRTGVVPVGVGFKKQRHTGLAFDLQQLFGHIADLKAGVVGQIIRYLTGEIDL